MIKTHFFHTLVTPETEKEPRIGSFNLTKVVRTVEYEPNKIVVLLDDFHESFVPKVTTARSGKQSVSERKEVVASEIPLTEEDTKRFRELVEIS